MELREPVMVCDSGGSGACGTGDSCAVIGEAPTLERLVLSMERWLRAHPCHAPRSFSHAVETRWKPRAGLAGPEAVTVYTGVLQVQAPSDADDGAELPNFVRAAFPHFG